ncbi:MAG TPA: glycosyltransferase family 2 protein [Chloroflexota bacterium]
MKPDRLTCIVVSYNGREYIGACLEGLLADVPPETVVVVDNASRDGTAELVRERFPAVRLIAAGRNLGYGAAANHGARHVWSEYLAVLNQDLVPCPGWAAALVEALDEDASAGLATSKILLASDPRRIDTCGNIVHYTGLATSRGHRAPARDFGARERVAAVSGAAFAIRTALFRQLGGFDESLFLYLEDTELSLRAQLAGCACLYVPQSVALHEHPAGFSPPKLFLLERNRLLMLTKLYRRQTLLALAPALLVAELAVLAYAIVRGPRHLAAKLHAYADAAWRLFIGRAAFGGCLPDAELLASCSAELDLGQLGPAGRLAAQLLNPFMRRWRRFVLGRAGRSD